MRNLIESIIAITLGIVFVTIVINNSIKIDMEDFSFCLYISLFGGGVLGLALIIFGVIKLKAYIDDSFIKRYGIWIITILFTIFCWDWLIFYFYYLFFPDYLESMFK